MWVQLYSRLPTNAKPINQTEWVHTMHNAHQSHYLERRGGCTTTHWPNGNHAPRNNEMHWTIPHFFDHGCLITVPFVSIGIVVNEVKKAGSTPHRHCT